jgi:hypothetical protein
VGDGVAGGVVGGCSICAEAGAEAHAQVKSARMRAIERVIRVMGR